jgi:hypothetical protein
MMWEGSQPSCRPCQGDAAAVSLFERASTRLAFNLPPHLACIAWKQRITEI